jgi:hypothetical protein
VQFSQALARGKGAAACDLLTPAMRPRLATLVYGVKPADLTSRALKKQFSCAGVITSLSARIEARQESARLTQIRATDFTTDRVNSSTAVVTRRQNGATAEVVKRNGRWQVTGGLIDN